MVVRRMEGHWCGYLESGRPLVWLLKEWKAIVLVVRRVGGHWFGC